MACIKAFGHGHSGPRIHGERLWLLFVVQFFDLFRDFSGWMGLVLPYWFTIPRLMKVKKARANIHQMLQSWIEERRKNLIDPPDFFQNLVNGQYPDGTDMPDEII